MKTIQVKNLNMHYGDFHVLMDVEMEILPREITAMIGPSGCGKSTLLRCFNRMNDLIENAKIQGEILYDGKNILKKETNLIELRKRVGMVFQRPNPFPLSIYDNVSFGPRIHGERKRSVLQDAVEKALRAVLLWDELKDRLGDSALKLSLEQQQRLTIARLIAVQPEVLLMDEPCSALDPIATQRVEELMFQLKEKYTIVIVTHNMQQAARVSEKTGFMLLGRLVEFGETQKIFTNPRQKETEDYVTGRFG